MVPAVTGLFVTFIIQDRRQSLAQVFLKEVTFKHTVPKMDREPMKQRSQWKVVPFSRLSCHIWPMCLSVSAHGCRIT